MFLYTKEIYNNSKSLWLSSEAHEQVGSIGAMSPPCNEFPPLSSGGMANFRVLFFNTNEAKIGYTDFLNSTHFANLGYT